MVQLLVYKENNFRKFHLQFIVSIGFQMSHLTAAYESAFGFFYRPKLKMT
jgi:hypothetical protein